MKWNHIRNNRNLPTSGGMYMITVSNIESGDAYMETRMTVMAKFQRTKSGYRWVWDDEYGTNTLTDNCIRSWTYMGSEYQEAVVAWADKPEPYNDDWSAIYSTIDKDNIEFGNSSDGSITATIFKVN